jgi:UDP-glucuronate 4-epimerase
MSIDTKHIIVTGSAGFIGFNLSKQLLAEGYKIIGIDNFNDYYLPDLKEARTAILKKNKNYIEKRINLEDYSELEKVFKEYKISAVCNLAAQAGVRYSLDHPFVYEKSNVSGFLNILELVRHYNVSRLVYASSSSVYGGNKKVPFSESDPVDNPISLYAATKKADELMAHCYSHLYGIQTVGLRFFTVYGPWGRPDMALWLFTEAITAGKPIKVFNHGKMQRDFTFIDDIITGVKASLFSKGLDQYEIFNIGNNNTEQLMHMISIIEDELGIKAKKEMLPMQPGDIPATFADIEKAKRKLGFNPLTKIEDGIPKFIRWYKEHPDLTAKAISLR